MVHPADLGRQELTAEAATSGTCRLRQQLFRDRIFGKGRDPSRPGEGLVPALRRRQGCGGRMFCRVRRGRSAA